ncbi:DUF3558 domain-containing protein [Nocardia terpenica]|uniref:DUF3558 domain-containing protein n=1 Tax=Nocardia terpenica TaxID=455432 RepID=A0A164H332_9NOCA|nr:DUF3558 domain-containing protein [Nocardia terpenica]KZM68160.1 hypothetical protein AWN90_09475 [Nocardia terpenica]NQE88980.1 DUF3558 domain-containing protein [Nocardia terpenica]
MRTALTIVLAGVSALALTACGSSTPATEATTAPATSTPPSIAVSVPAPPAQKNRTGRPAVTFDPCTGIGDAEIQKLGFDPSTRKRDDLAADTYTFLGCNFGQKNAEGWNTRTLEIKASNLTLQDFRTRPTESLTNTTIAGRDAVTYLLAGSAVSGTCFLAMDSPVGVINLQLDLNLARVVGKPCDEIPALATTLQQDLPKQ